MLIACPGLDHVWRGFETLARECFEALRAEGSLEVRLVKGSGPRGAGEQVARTAGREGRAARAGAGLLRRSSYDVEQIGFAASMAPVLLRYRPAVVYVSDWLTSRLLARLRARARLRYRLVISNGGPWPPDLLRHADHVQEITPPALDAALAAGEPPERHTLLPLGVAMPASFQPLAYGERAGLRRSLGLPPERRVVLSVGALSIRDKRVDYLIEELASLPQPRPLLLLLGAEGPDAAAVRALAATALGEDGFVARTAPSAEVASYYRAADVFALASFVESFGRVMAEAMSHGLPCVAHDGPVQRYLLGPHGHFGDFARPGRLAGLVAALDDGDSSEGAGERHRYVHDRFSWDVLTPRYAGLLRQCAASATGSG